MLFFVFSLRNGLRPSRFYVLKDNIMVMASEVGVYDTDPSNVALKVRISINTLSSHPDWKPIDRNDHSSGLKPVYFFNQRILKINF